MQIKISYNALRLLDRTTHIHKNGQSILRSSKRLDRNLEAFWMEKSIDNLNSQI